MNTFPPIRLVKEMAATIAAVRTVYPGAFGNPNDSIYPMEDLIWSGKG